MSFKFPQALFWIGSPIECKPNHDISVIQKFVKDFPDWAVIFILETEAQQKALSTELEKLKFPKGHPGALALVWTNDEELMDMLCGDLHFLQTWKVVGGAWYECEDKHESASTLAQPLEKCPKCEKPVVFIRQHEERVKHFTEVLKSSVNLMNFDTSSGIALHEAVNPTANVMRNLPIACGLPEAPALDLEDFIGKGRGKTAFCVSAGPSLKRDIEHLRRLHEGALVLCVGRVYKMLREAGIHVDYTFSCEMFDWDSAIFDGFTKEYVGETILGYPPVCSPATVKKWPGKRLCLFDANTAELLDRKVDMMGGNSVSHHQYNFAGEILQCDQIVLVGQDLAYTEPGQITHADHSNHSWPEEIRVRDQILQDEDWGPVTSDKAGPFYAERHKMAGTVGGCAIVPIGPVLVRTSPSYKCFGNLFEILIKRHKKQTWNSCGNGLKIVGAPYLDLSTFTTLEDCRKLVL